MRLGEHVPEIVGTLGAERMQDLKFVTREMLTSLGIRKVPVKRLLSEIATESARGTDFSPWQQGKRESACCSVVASSISVRCLGHICYSDLFLHEAARMAWQMAGQAYSRRRIAEEDE